MSPNSNQPAELVGLLDVTTAAERGAAPLGPEFAGFVVLEAAHRVRDAGGGVVDSGHIALTVGGEVTLVAPPRRAGEGRATASLRAVLHGVLEVATSSTPALRACAGRRDHAGFGALIRELEGALVPLNRSASRRGVARVARETLDALLGGRLEPAPTPEAVAQGAECAEGDDEGLDDRTTDDRDVAWRVPPPRTIELAARDVPCACEEPVVAAPAPGPAPAPAPADMEAVVASVPSVAEADERAGDEPTPYDPRFDLAPRATLAIHSAEAETPRSRPPIEPRGTSTQDVPAAPHDDRVVADPWGTLPPDDGADEIEIVSQLPPLVEPMVPESVSHAIDVRAAAVEHDRVRALLAGFKVSNDRDHSTLHRDLKRLAEVESVDTRRVAPIPAIRPIIRDAGSLGRRPDHAPEVDADDPPDSTDSNHGVTATAYPDPLEASRVSPVRRSRGLSAALVACTCLVAFGAVASLRRGALAGAFELSPPPGDEASRSATLEPLHASGKPAASTLAKMAGATGATRATRATLDRVVHLPSACEASLTLEGVTAGVEVARRLGVAPLTAALPAHVPLELVATLEGPGGGGIAHRRVRVDASAPWQDDAIAPRLELPVTLDGLATMERRWPARFAGANASGSMSGVTRGLATLTSVPDGATFWLVVDPANVGGLPCGSAVDLMVVPAAGGAHVVRVEWASFVGVPPRAVVPPAGKGGLGG